MTLICSHVDTDSMNKFLEQLSEQIGENEAYLIMDNAPWHKSKNLQVPHNIEILFLPPYSPELNPVERFWQYLKNNTLKNKIYYTLSSLEIYVSQFINALDASIVRNICEAKYLLN